MSDTPPVFNLVLGKVIVSARENRGLKQSELATAAGIHATALSKIERGLSSPTVTTLRAVAAGLDLTPQELLARCEQVEEEMGRIVGDRIGDEKTDSKKWWMILGGAAGVTAVIGAAIALRALAGGRGAMGPVEPAPMDGIDRTRCDLMRLTSGDRPVVLEGEFEDPAAVRGEAYFGDRRIVIPTAGPRAVVRTVIQGEDVRIVVDGGAVRVFRVLAAPDAPAGAPGRQHSSVPHARLAPPSLADLPGAADQEAWLRDAVADKLASDRYADRVIGIGLIARLWTPVGSDEAERSLRALLDGEAATPAMAARRWAQDLDRETCEELGQHGIEAARSLRARLDGSGEAIAAAVAEAFVLGLVLQRDDLESLATVLRFAGASSHLDAALDQLDRSAVTHLTALSSVVGLGEDDRLRAVAWQEPDAWWGGLAAADAR